MKPNLSSKLLLTAAVGILATGAIASAQEPSASQKPAYYISEFTVTDSEGIKPYSAQVESTFKPFSGRYIVRGGGDIASLEGTEQRDRVVIIAFDSMEKAQAWYNSPEYTKLRPIRQKSATSRVFIVDGVPN